MRRIELQHSQETVAKKLGLTFQQLQKYENGTNRVSASKLYEIAKILSVPISFFFDEEQNELGKSDLLNELEARQIKDGLQLLKAFMNIEDPVVRRKALLLIESLARATEK